MSRRRLTAAQRNQVAGDVLSPSSTGLDDQRNRRCRGCPQSGSIAIVASEWYATQLFVSDAQTFCIGLAPAPDLCWAKSEAARGMADAGWGMVLPLLDSQHAISAPCHGNPPPIDAGSNMRPVPCPRSSEERLDGGRAQCLPARPPPVVCVPHHSLPPPNNV